MAVGDAGGPAFDLGGIHLDGMATRAAHEVMVVIVGPADPVQRFAVVGLDHIDVTGSRKGLQGPIHGR